MINAKEALGAAQSYLRKHPEELVRAMRQAAGLRFGVPMAAFRWLGHQVEKGGAVKRLDISADPPGLRVVAEVSAMQTPIRAELVIIIDEIRMSATELRIALRLEDVKLTVTGPAETPVAALIRSGALDLSQPGNLAAYIPNRPKALIEAEGSRLVLDLMREPSIAKNPVLRRAVSLITAFITVRGIETDPDHLDISCRALPAGISAALATLSQELFKPGLQRLIPA